MADDGTDFDNRDVRAAPAVVSPQSVSSLDQFRSLAEPAAKLILAISLLLYSIGLFISNVYFQQFGLTAYNLVRAQYILVGLLWLFLVVLCWVITKEVLDTARALVRTWGSATTQRFGFFRRVFWHLLWVATPLYIGANIIAQLGARGLSAWEYFLLVTMVGTNLAGLALLASAISHAARGAKSPSPRERNPAYIASLCGVMLTALVGYSLFAFPSFDQSFGGGRLHKIELFLKPEKALALKQLGLDVTKDGRLGPVWLISEGSDGFLITTSQSIFHAYPAYRINRDSVEVGKYTQ